jgi:hypothetical protein
MNRIKEIIILLLIAVSCSSNGKKADSKSEDKRINETGVTASGGALPVLKIRRPSGKLPMLKLSEMADDIRYVKLETHDNALLASCRVFRSDSSACMFLLYKMQIYKFDDTGKFIKRIGRSGQGPGEFTPHHVDVDFQKKLIYVFPGSPGNERDCILKLDFDGNILEKVKNELVHYPTGMALFGGELIFLNDPVSTENTKQNKGGYMQLYLFNPDSNRIGSYLPNPWLEDLKDRKFTSASHAGKEMLAIDNDVAYYKFILNDTVYKISSRGINPFLIMDTEKNFKLEDYLNRRFDIKMLNGKMKIQKVKAFKNHLIFWFLFTKDFRNQEYEAFLCLYDLKTGKLSYHDYTVLNDLDGGPNFCAGPSSILEISLLKNPSEEIREFYYGGHDNIELKFPEKKNGFQKLIDLSDEEDNPIIQIISFRDDF